MDGYFLKRYSFPFLFAREIKLKKRERKFRETIFIAYLKNIYFGRLLE